jgi:hypothetical protein
MSRFTELCEAFQRAQSEFQNFQNDCHHFSEEMVKNLKEYFEIPDSQLSLFSINEHNDFESAEGGMETALTLREDSFWEFGIGLTVCCAPEKLPKELILIHIMVRKDLEGNYFLRYANEEQERKIEKKSERFDFIPFFNFLHKTIITTYDEKLTYFIGQDTRRKIGY